MEDLLGQAYTDIKEMFPESMVPEPEKIGDQEYVSLNTEGVGFLIGSNKKILTIHLHSERHEHFKGYAKPLPGGVRFTMSRTEVRNLLGEPDEEGESAVLPILGSKPAWDAFDLGNIRLHIEYVPDLQSIQLVTLSKK